MHVIQSFLIVVLCGFIWLTIILGLALAEEITIFDKDWRVKQRIQDGTVYGRDWNTPLPEEEEIINKIKPVKCHQITD